jgi:2-iminobutanoate/2-iminopropanoate deaminase
MFMRGRLCRTISSLLPMQQSPHLLIDKLSKQRLVFVSGTAPTDPATGQIKGNTIQEQTRQCLTNVSAILEAAGTSMDKIVSATFILADEDEFAGMNEEWARWFPTDPPARQGAKLPARIPGLKVSVAVIAEA